MDRAGELREIEALIAWNGEFTDVAAAAIAGARENRQIRLVEPPVRIAP
jgi:hypothetical protein